MIPNSKWNAVEREERSEWVRLQYQTDGTSIGYPPGLTRERFISLARNIVNRGIFSKTLFTKKMQKHYSRTFSYSD